MLLVGVNMKTKKNRIKLVPPDGGWGWLIVLGSSLINFSTRAIEPSFGLLFGDLLKQLGVETTGASLVISTLGGIVNFSGLIVGPLIKKYTYRKVAIIGAIISTAAIMLTAPANSMIHILITFGVLGGIGFGLSTACTLVGINDYFSKKKGQAVGLSMTGTAVGFMLMPQIVGFLLDEYDFRSALLIIGALSLHATVGACLFQPVSWHKKAVVVEVEEEEAHTLLPPDKVEKKDSIASIETTNGVRRNVSSPNLEGRKNLLNIPPQAFSRKASLISNVSLLDDAGNTFHIQGIAEEESDNELEKITVNSYVEETHVKNNLKPKPTKTVKNSLKDRLSKFSKFMDLDLLRDGVYLNILYGLSMCIVAEMNFKLIVPFFLSNLGFKHSEIAFALSSMAVSDICARIVVPPIMDRITFSRRATFIFGSVCVALGRSCLALQTTMVPIITALVIIGFFRGISLTSFPLVLAEYSSGNNFPSVLGLSMVSRGVFIAIFGPLSGYIRDVTNSYPLFIHSQTVLMASVLIAWIVEIIILKSKNNKHAIIDALQKETEDKNTETKT
ncbi:monocarboxylate transporter 12 isoform X2 [Halyomorpha halys]|uniref:monocarboxylate transporter 12 isoform X2 n=1 Tax=Halyomorpha halys TaxID=286706 RepID=UPI0006D4CD5B|nr:monocarboxylate transporter 14 isoform X2 [Halyomorpha halys]